MLNDIVDLLVSGFGSPTIADIGRQPGGVGGGFLAIFGLLFFTGFVLPPAGWIRGAAFKEDTFCTAGTNIPIKFFENA